MEFTKHFQSARKLIEEGLNPKPPDYPQGLASEGGIEGGKRTIRDRGQEGGKRVICC